MGKKRKRLNNENKGEDRHNAEHVKITNDNVQQQKIFHDKKLQGENHASNFKQKDIANNVIIENSLSVAGRPLPSLPQDYDVNKKDKMGSILLFYQYREPMWTDNEFQKVLKQFVALGQKHSITGRGRIAKEGVNCTLTGSSPNIRAFCQSLRKEFDPTLFAETDFKITDNIPHSQLFKSLSVRKTDELVAYGLANEKAPSIQQFGGTHLTAMEYHEALQDPNTVVIDVRNQYETAIGTMMPPPGGAKLIDPKLRNSHEWPKWLASKGTQQQLHGKKVLTFCTGGIRCERATALINQMAVVSANTSSNGGVADEKSSNMQDAFQPQGVYHMRGGIERYLKTFPEGGFWSGKNYLFDKRMEQLPEQKDILKVEKEVMIKLQAKCCRCRQAWTSYRGKHKCSEIQCGVPVIVCDACHVEISGNTSSSIVLRCELCREGYRAPQDTPDLLSVRLQAEKLIKQKTEHHKVQSVVKQNGPSKDESGLRQRLTTSCTNRLFLSRLPLTACKSSIEEWLKRRIKFIHWLTDKETGAFYGSCIVQVDPEFVTSLLSTTNGNGNGTDRPGKETDVLSHDLGPFPGTKSEKKKRKKHQQPRITQAMAREGDIWPPVDYQETEFPPIGNAALVNTKQAISQ